MGEELKIIECPRDAMQGKYFLIPTELKRRYINCLLDVGFDTIDFGSFVSHKAVPQMADTAQVLAGLDRSQSKSKLLAIVANFRGAEDACEFPEIEYIGYPFSISETFQYNNTRLRIHESWDLVKEVKDMCAKHEKELVVYLSMGFGNPYGDAYSPEIVEEWAEKMAGIGIHTLSLADTIGSAEPELITPLFETLIPRYPHIEFGAHFHSHPATRREKLKAAWEAGCRRFDVAVNGHGGCPFAQDKLVGNIATESLVEYLGEIGVEHGLDLHRLKRSMMIANEVFAMD